MYTHFSCPSCVLHILPLILIKLFILKIFGEERNAAAPHHAVCPSFLYFISHIPEPTQPPISLVPGALSPEVKQPGLEADHSYLVPKSRMFFNILQENHDLNKTFICLEDLFRQKISGPDSKWC